MPKKNTSVINLLPQEEFQKSPLGRTLHWATTTFRSIVVVTEMVVIVAFLSRFWLDAKNADLNDIIRQNQAVITSYEDFEKEFRGLQQRIKIFSGLTESDTLSSFTTKAINLLPEDVRLVSISQVGDSLQIKAASASERSIVQYIANLVSDKSFTDLKVANAATSSENSAVLVFTIETKFSQISQKGGS